MTTPGAEMDEYVTVAELLARRLERLTPAERKVARTLTAQYPLPGLDTVSRFAERAGVSAPTVIRLVDKLGFDGYADFQQALKSELGERLSSPLTMYATHEMHEASGIGETMQHAIETFEAGIRSSLSQIQSVDLLAVAELLAGKRRRAITVGGRFSGFLAGYLAAHLQQIRPQVTNVSDSPAERAAVLLDVSRKDVVLAFDYRRYQRDTVRFGEAAKERGATVVLFTDPWLSPLAGKADHVLQTSVSAPSPFDSLVPALALVEALVAVLVDRLGDEPRPRLAQMDELTQQVTSGMAESEG